MKPARCCFRRCPHNEEIRFDSHDFALIRLSKFLRHFVPRCTVPFIPYYSPLFPLNDPDQSRPTRKRDCGSLRMSHLKSGPIRTVPEQSRAIRTLQPALARHRRFAGTPLLRHSNTPDFRMLYPLYNSFFEKHRDYPVNIGLLYCCTCKPHFRGAPPPFHGPQ